MTFGNDYFWLGFVLLLVSGIAAFIAMIWLDRRRIAEEVAALGGKVVDITWEVFGPGWIGDGSHRLYSVTYRDIDGVEQTQFCKTSLLSGVYFTPISGGRIKLRQ